MANYCSNYLEISGGVNNVEKVVALFDDMISQEAVQKRGQKFPFQSVLTQEYCFDIYKLDENTLYYTTKWTPNTTALEELSRIYNVKLILIYSEPAMFEFGKVIFNKEGVQTFQLESEDFMKYEYDEDLEAYIYKGLEYMSEHDLLELILEEKINPTTLD